MLELYEPLAPEQLDTRARLASIGPITTAALRDRGLEPHVEATEHDIDGLLAALVAHAASST